MTIVFCGYKKEDVPFMLAVGTQAVMMNNDTNLAPIPLNDEARVEFENAMSTIEDQFEKGDASK